MRKKTLLAIGIVATSTFISSTIDLNSLLNYENQGTPQYVSEDNTPQNNTLSDAGATLGRILFYDVNLSRTNEISCASCHKQEYGFSDTAVVSTGVNGVTGRHSMRLINARYSTEERAFWDERATSFEDQATQPIRDHVEMGYSGANGDPDFDQLIEKLENLEYYPVLFEFVFGDSQITETRIQHSLAQFVRSIESFDSKYDEGRAQVTSDQMTFPNYTSQENLGKQLYFSGPPAGGAGCMRCHNAPEFTLIPNCDNNGVIGVANDSSAIDLTVTHSPTLRDLVNPNGELNGPLMHDGSLTDLMSVVDHYNDLQQVSANTNLDHRLAGAMHDIDLNQTEKDALVSFLLTLTGSNVYSDEKWANPFDAQGNLALIPLTPNGAETVYGNRELKLYPNPSTLEFQIELDEGYYQLEILDLSGKRIRTRLIRNKHTENISELAAGAYKVQVLNLSTQESYSQTLIKK